MGASRHGPFNKEKSELASILRHPHFFSASAICEGLPFFAHSLPSTCTGGLHRVFMPESVFGYNETKAQSSVPRHSPNMTAASLAARGPRIPHEPTICPTDSDTVVPKKHRTKTKLDKSSWEYIVKSGVAGGFAGCAVSRTPTDYEVSY